MSIMMDKENLKLSRRISGVFSSLNFLVLALFIVFPAAPSSAGEGEFGKISFKAPIVHRPLHGGLRTKICKRVLTPDQSIVPEVDFKEVRDEVARHLHERSRGVSGDQPVIRNRNGVEIPIPDAMMALAAEQILTATRGVPLQRLPRAIALWVQLYIEGPLRAEQRERRRQEDERALRREKEGPISMELVSQYPPLQNGLPANSTLFQRSPWGARTLLQQARVRTLGEKNEIAGKARDLLAGFKSGEEETIEIGLAENVAKAARDIRALEKQYAEKRAHYGLNRLEDPLPRESDEIAAVRKQEAMLAEQKSRLDEITKLETPGKDGVVDLSTLASVSENAGTVTVTLLKHAEARKFAEEETEKRRAQKPKKTGSAEVAAPAEEIKPLTDDDVRKFIADEIRRRRGMIEKEKPRVKQTIQSLEERLPMERAKLKAALAVSADAGMVEWSAGISRDRPLPEPAAKITELTRLNAQVSAARQEYKDTRNRLADLIGTRSQESWLPEVNEALKIAQEVASDFERHRRATLTVTLLTGVDETDEKYIEARQTIAEVEGSWLGKLHNQYAKELKATQKGFERALKLEEDMVERAQREIRAHGDPEPLVQLLNRFVEHSRGQRVLEQRIDEVTIVQDRAEAAGDGKVYLAKAAEIEDLSRQAKEAKTRMAEVSEEIAALADNPQTRVVQRTHALLSVLWDFARVERLKTYSTRRAQVFLDAAGAIDLDTHEVTMTALEADLVKFRADFEAELAYERATSRMGETIKRMLWDQAKASESNLVAFQPQRVLEDAVVILTQLIDELELALPINGAFDVDDVKKNPRLVLRQPPTAEELKKIPSPVKRVAPDGTVSFSIPMPGLRSVYEWHPRDSTTKLTPERGAPLGLGEMVMLVPGMGGERSVDVFTHAVANLLSGWGYNPTTTLPPQGGHLGPLLEGVLTRLAFYVQIAENEDQSLGGNWSAEGTRHRSPWPRTMWGRSMGGWLALMLTILGVDSHVVDSHIGVSVTLPRSNEELQNMFHYLMRDAHAAGRALDPARMQDANRLCYESYVLIQEMLKTNPNFSRRLGKNFGMAQGDADVDALVYPDGLRHAHDDLEKARREGLIPLLSHIFYFFDLEWDPAKPDKRTESERKGKQGGHFLFSGDPATESEGTQLAMYSKGLTDYLIHEGEATGRQVQMGEAYRKKHSTVLHYKGINGKYAKIEAGPYLNDFGQELGLTQDDLDSAAREYSASFQIYETTELDGPSVSQRLRGAAELAKSALYATDKKKKPAEYKKNLAFRYLAVLIYWQKESERVKREEARHFTIEPPKVNRELDGPKPFQWIPVDQGGQQGQVYWHPLGITGESPLPLQQGLPKEKKNKGP